MTIRDTYFVDDDGTPLFWLADTAWNAALRADEDEWEEYLEARAAQGFTVIQFVATKWRGCSKPIHGNLYQEGNGKLLFPSEPWSKMSQWIEKINAHGMIAAPVMLWANQKACPGQALSEEHCIELGRRMVDAWQQHAIVWMLAGDSNYESDEQVARWSRIGRAIFEDHPDAIVTMHPCGQSWVGDKFAEEDWYSFVGIQSGHGSTQRNLQWLLQGPYSQAWRSIPKPFVNLEPNYETAIAYGTQSQFGAYHVRRASYWSLLVAPPAGITYGHNSIWVWAQTENEHAEGHGTNWVAQPWRTGLDTEGIRSLTILKEIFAALPWTELRPAQELLIAQPGEQCIEAFVTLAATKERDCVVVYLPKGQEIGIRTDELKPGLSAFWVDPRTGKWKRQALPEANGQAPFVPPSEEEWLLVVKLSTGEEQQASEEARQ